MSGILNLETQVRVLACPACSTTLNTTYSRCPACGVSISRAESELAADAMAVLNSACADANYVGGLLGTLFGIIGGVVIAMLKSHITFLVAGGGVPLQGVFLALYCACMIAALGMPLVVALAARWWVRFSHFVSPDKDLPKARRIVLVSAAVALAFDLTMTGLTLWLRPF